MDPCVMGCYVMGCYVIGWHFMDPTCKSFFPGSVFPREERGRLELQEARQESSSLATEVSRLKGKQGDLESILEVARRETGARDAEIKVRWKVLSFFFLGGGGNFFSFFIQNSALLHLPPLRFHCGVECWDRTQDRSVRRSNHWARSHPQGARSHPWKVFSSLLNNSFTYFC